MSKRTRARFAELDRARGRRLIQEARAVRALSQSTSAIEALAQAARPPANDDVAPPTRSTA